MAKKKFLSRMEDAPVLMQDNYTDKQKKFIKGILIGKRPSEASVEAGYKSKASITPKIRNAIDLLMDRAGMRDEDLVKDLKEGLKEANKFYGNGDNMVERPDYAVRHKYLETALKLKGKLQGEQKSEREPIQILIVDYDANKNQSTT